MSDQVDYFPGFASHWIDTEAGKIFARTHDPASSGTELPVLLLHGFGQTHIAWRTIAPALAQTRPVVVMDLRGYGWSATPASDKGESYTKREMARDVVKVMEELGHVQFALVGHDRGARVGLRLALDHPGRVAKFALLNIAPEDDAFGEGDLQRAGRARFLATEVPRPEDLIALDPVGFLDDALKSSTKARSLDVFAPPALDAYRQAFNDPVRIHAFCEDFRAGATFDKAHLAEDRSDGKKLLMPTLIVAGDASFPPDGALLEAWRQWRDDVTETRIDAGLYLMDEAPAATLAALQLFL